MTQSSQAASGKVTKLNRVERNAWTKRKIFDAATKVVGKHGYAEASVARITEEAGVARHGGEPLGVRLLQQADGVGRAGLPALGVDRGEELGPARRPGPAVVVGDLRERRERLREAGSEGGSRRGEVCGTGVHGGTCYQTAS